MPRGSSGASRGVRIAGADFRWRPGARGSTARICAEIRCLVDRRRRSSRARRGVWIGRAISRRGPKLHGVQRSLARRGRARRSGAVPRRHVGVSRSASPPPCRAAAAAAARWRSPPPGPGRAWASSPCMRARRQRRASSPRSAPSGHAGLDGAGLSRNSCCFVLHEGRWAGGRHALARAATLVDGANRTNYRAARAARESLRVAACPRCLPTAPRARRRMNATIPKTPCCTSSCASTSRPSSPAYARSAGRTFRATSFKSCGGTFAVESWPMDFFASCARRVARKSSWLSRASAEARAPPAPRDGCATLERTWWITFSPTRA